MSKSLAQGIQFLRLLPKQLNILGDIVQLIQPHASLNPPHDHLAAILAKIELGLLED